MVTTSTPKSILTKEFMTSILTIAQSNLERENFLVAMLFVKRITTSGSNAVGMPLTDLPYDMAKRPQYFHDLGLRLRRDIGIVEEAVFLHEVWWAPVTSPHDIGRVAPSAHPARQEAILLVGRDVSNTHPALLVQPFTRDKNNSPVWDNMPIESCGQQGTIRFQGVLDDFFKGNLQTVFSS